MWERRWALRATLACCACALAAHAGADSLASATPVDDQRLADVRGGFETPARLHAALQLERAVYVNGDLVAEHDVRIAEIGAMTAAEATALADATRTLVSQNGPHNSFDPGGMGQAATVIQNTLNDQHLVAMTTLGVEVNTLGAFRETNFQDALRESLGAVGGVR
jgi:hypothetical protein